MGEEVDITDGDGGNSKGAHVGEVGVSVCDDFLWGLDVVVGGVSGHSAAQSESEGNSNEGLLHICNDHFFNFLTFFLNYK